MVEFGHRPLQVVFSFVLVELCQDVILCREYNSVVVVVFLIIEKKKPLVFIMPGRFARNFR